MPDTKEETLEKLRFERAIADLVNEPEARIKIVDDWAAFQSEYGLSEAQMGVLQAIGVQVGRSDPGGGTTCCSCCCP